MMATIVFMSCHWASDLSPTFALASKLRDRGHRVHYLGIPDTAERIRSQDFDFNPPLLVESFPKAR
jgi:UDP:flavonoid glycosyltransferase YjiC (YdhE family)